MVNRPRARQPEEEWPLCLCLTVVNRPRARQPEEEWPLRLSLLCSHGTFEANEVALKKGDGAEITDINKITITAKSDCEVLLIDLPK